MAGMETAPSKSLGVKSGQQQVYIALLPVLTENGQNWIEPIGSEVSRCWSVKEAGVRCVTVLGQGTRQVPEHSLLFVMEKFNRGCDNDTWVQTALECKFSVCRKLSVETVGQEGWHLPLQRLTCFFWVYSAAFVRAQLPFNPLVACTGLPAK